MLELSEAERAFFDGDPHSLNYHEGFCMGYRESSTQAACRLFHHLENTTTPDESVKCILKYNQELYDEYHRFREQYGDISMEKLADHINRESEYLFVFRFPD